MADTPEPVTSQVTVELVVKGLIAFSLIGLLGIIVMIGLKRPAAELVGLVGLVGPPSGALGALLVSTRSNPPAVPDPAP